MPHPLDLTGKTILVTGASSGIGRATAILLGALGARVILSGRQIDGLEKTAAQMEGGCHQIAPFDLVNFTEIGGWVEGLVGEFGRLHGLVHSAGVAPVTPLRRLSLESLQELMGVNFYAAALLTKQFASKRVHQENSSLVFISSVAGYLGAAGRSAYSATKGALIAFARSAALELAPNGVRVNCIAPSYVATEMYNKALAAFTPEQIEAEVKARQPLGLGNPLDVANAAAFLLADTGRWITGSVLPVDGGYSSQ
jgi:NAD(P)-dependent dehydrogenase (short-subunit alcohol dehydrogenase family)